MKKEGLLPGASDLFITEPVGEFHGLFLEMKRTIIKGGKKPVLSKVQKNFAKEVSIRGYAFAVAYGYTDALVKVLDYLESRHYAYKETQASFNTVWSEESCLSSLGPENQRGQGNLQIA